jgi:hypothetical protein
MFAEVPAVGRRRLCLSSWGRPRSVMVRQPWPAGKPAVTAVTIVCCSNADSTNKGTPRGSSGVRSSTPILRAGQHGRHGEFSRTTEGGRFLSQLASVHRRGRVGLDGDESRQGWMRRRRSAIGRYCCKSPRGAARPGKFGNNRIRIAGSVNQNSRFDPWARKLFFVPAPKIVLQQYRPCAAIGGRSSTVSYLACCEPVGRCEGVRTERRRTGRTRPLCTMGFRNPACPHAGPRRPFRRSIHAGFLRRQPPATPLAAGADTFWSPTRAS